MSKRKERARAREEAVLAEARLPETGDELPVVTMRAARSGHHPWIYRRMLEKADERVPRGALAEVRDRGGAFIGRGFYNQHSEIAFRILCEDEAVFPGREFFHARIADAVSLRRDVLRLDEVTDAFRVIHSEGDGLSGLVVDRFGGTLVVEIFSAGIHRHLDWVLEGLLAAFPGSELLVRADRRNERLEGVKMDVRGQRPRQELVVIHEHGLSFVVDLRRGHKTGFFLDQRDNRARVAELCRGGDVFDGFCYTGGFALGAIRAGAARVQAVDLDEDAVATALENARRNGMHGDPRLEIRHGNVFEVLREHRMAGRSFTRILLDPPKLASSRADRGKALAAYADMNRLAMLCLEPGGVLVSNSCTGLITEDELLGILRSTSGKIGCELQVLAVHGAAGDHPWSLPAPEGRYLKCVTTRLRPLHGRAAVG